MSGIFNDYDNVKFDGPSTSSAAGDMGEDEFTMESLGPAGRARIDALMAQFQRASVPQYTGTRGFDGPDDAMARMLDYMDKFPKRQLVEAIDAALGAPAATAIQPIHAPAHATPPQPAIAGDEPMTIDGKQSSSGIKKKVIRVNAPRPPPNKYDRVRGLADDDTREKPRLHYNADAELRRSMGALSISDEGFVGIRDKAYLQQRIGHIRTYIDRPHSYSTAAELRELIHNLYAMKGDSRAAISNIDTVSDVAGKMVQGFFLQALTGSKSPVGPLEADFRAGSKHDVDFYQSSRADACILLTSPEYKGSIMDHMETHTLQVFRRAAGPREGSMNTFAVRSFVAHGAAMNRTQFQTRDGKWLALFDVVGSFGHLKNKRPTFHRGIFMLVENTPIWESVDQIAYGFVGDCDWGFVLVFNKSPASPSLEAFHTLSGPGLKPYFGPVYNRNCSEDVRINVYRPRNDKQAELFQDLINQASAPGFVDSKGFADFFRGISNTIGWSTFRQALNHNDVVKLTSLSEFSDELLSMSDTRPIASDLLQAAEAVKNANFAGVPKNWMVETSASPEFIEIALYNTAGGALGFNKKTKFPTIRIYKPSPDAVQPKNTYSVWPEMRIAHIKASEHPPLKGVDFFNAKQRGQITGAEMVNVLWHTSVNPKSQNTVRQLRGYPASFIFRLDRSNDDVFNALFKLEETMLLAGVAMFDPVVDKTGAIDTFVLLANYKVDKATTDTHGVIEDIYLLYRAPRVQTPGETPGAAAAAPSNE
jgi:hypothetical protein